MTQPKELDARAELSLGIAVLIIALVSHGVITTANTGYVLHQFGVPMLAAYLAATAGILLFPYLVHYVENKIHFKITNVLLMFFVSWITIEENFHASKGWHVPEGATQLASLAFSPEYAPKVATVMLVFASYGVLEFLSHLLHLGGEISHRAHHRIRGHHHKG